MRKERKGKKEEIITITKNPSVKSFKRWLQEEKNRVYKGGIFYELIKNGETHLIFGERSIANDLFSFWMGKHLAFSGNHVLYYSLGRTREIFSYFENSIIPEHLYYRRIDSDTRPLNREEAFNFIKSDLADVSTDCVLIVNHVRELKSGSDRKSDAQNFITRLKDLKTELSGKGNKLTILVFAESKRIDPWEFVSLAQIQEEFFFSFDNIIGIGRSSKYSNHIYLKQLKRKDNYSGSEILLLEEERNPGDHSFKIKARANEQEHLQIRPEVIEAVLNGFAIKLFKIKYCDSMNSLKSVEHDKAEEFIKNYIRDTLHAICPSGGIIEPETLKYILENTGITSPAFDKIASEFFSEKGFTYRPYDNKRKIEK
jgi:hypothetical protein